MRLWRKSDRHNAPCERKGCGVVDPEGAATGMGGRRGSGGDVGGGLLAALDPRLALPLRLLRGLHGGGLHGEDLV